MTNRGDNQGIRALDDFICAAIHPTGTPGVNSPQSGRNEGVRVADADVRGAENGQRTRPTVLDAYDFDRAIQTVIAELAEIAAAPELANSTAPIHKRLNEQMNTLQNARELLRTWDAKVHGNRKTGTDGKG